MSYFANIRCPKCGKGHTLHLGGFGFYGVGNQHCSYCGNEFDPQNNCTNMELDKDDPAPKKVNNRREGGMRSRSDIIKEYEKCKEGGTLTVTDIDGREWSIDNKSWLNKLTEEYNNSLSKDEQLAIAMHSKLCRDNHIDRCSFYYEVDGLVHNFGGAAHQHWLSKANKYINAFPADLTVDQMITILSATV